MKEPINTPSTLGLDVIGDIHGQYEKLRQLLEKLGYHPHRQTFRHPEGRRVAFLGDYIDRGPQIREVLQTVRAMVEEGDAVAIMGNHEFNALGFHTSNGRGGWFRERSDRKLRQHMETLRQVVFPYPEEWPAWLDWFRRLPMALEVDGLRLVHACWDEVSVRVLAQVGPLNDEMIGVLSSKETQEGQARTRVLNGPEMQLPEGISYRDKENILRQEVRVQWWKKLAACRYPEIVFPPGGEIDDRPVDASFIPVLPGYPENAPPVCFGHYWLKPNLPMRPQAPNVLCLDTSAGLGGPLTAYRWDGESNFNPAKIMQA